MVQLLADRLPVARQLEAHARDISMRVAADDRGDSRLAIIDIDEDSLKRIGPWPWPREKLADLAERLLADGGVSVVAFDLILTDPSQTEEARIGDARLASLAAQGWLVAAQAFDYVERDEKVTVGHPGGGFPAAALAPAVRATGYVGNYESLASGRCVGNIGFVPDPDGKVRRIAPWTRWADARYPAYALAVLQCLQPGLDIAQLSRRIPTDAQGLWAIPFSARPDSYLAIPAEAVLSGQLADLAPGRLGQTAGRRPLEGRIAVVGSSALGLSDRVATPMAPSVSGVTVHAAALSALLDMASGQSPRTAPPWAMAAWLVLSVGALWLLVARGARLRLMLASVVTVLGVWGALALWISTAGGSHAVTGPLWGYACILLLHLPVEWSWAHKRVRRRTRLLSRYVARAVLDELLEAPEEDPMAPRGAEITVMIADMQDYTRLTSRSSLETAARLTRDFLEQLTEPVLARRGTLDRYTGDGLVAFWGAPIAIEDHADRAVDAAADVVANIARFNEARRARGEDPVRVRIGIASGSALVGDLGTQFRAAYTAVGDCINLASRLQQLSRELDVSIAVASSSVQRCRRWRFRALGTAPVRGLPDQQVFTPDPDPSPPDR